MLNLNTFVINYNLSHWFKFVHMLEVIRVTLKDDHMKTSSIVGLSVCMRKVVNNTSFLLKRFTVKKGLFRKHVFSLFILKFFFYFLHCRQSYSGRGPALQMKTVCCHLRMRNYSSVLRTYVMSSRTMRRPWLSLRFSRTSTAASSLLSPPCCPTHWRRRESQGKK